MTPQPNFTGTWRMNFAKSILRTPAPQSMLVRLDHREPVLMQEILVTRIPGAEQRMTFTFEAGAETTNSIGGATARTRARWNRSELVFETTMKTPSGEVYFEDHWSLSDDGLTLTMAHRDGALQGQITVLEKG
jgi:hypothetical protein